MRRLVIGCVVGVAVGVMACEESSDLGVVCDIHGYAYDARLDRYFPVTDCEHAACIFMHQDDPPAVACLDALDCDAADVEGRSGVYVCEDGECQFSDDYVAARSLCTRPCESDTDCRSASADTPCETGFRCASVDDGDWCVCRDEW